MAELARLFREAKSDHSIEVINSGECWTRFRYVAEYEVRTIASEILRCAQVFRLSQIAIEVEHVPPKSRYVTVKPLKVGEAIYPQLFP